MFSKTNVCIEKTARKQYPKKVYEYLVGKLNINGGAPLREKKFSPFLEKIKGEFQAKSKVFRINLCTIYDEIEDSLCKQTDFV